MDGRYALGLAEGIVLGLMTGAGIAAVRGGWVPRQDRRRVFRPRLWGQGMLLLTASLAFMSLSLALLGPSPVWFALSFVGYAGLVGGGALLHRARRDRRRG